MTGSKLDTSQPRSATEQPNFQHGKRSPIQVGGSELFFFLFTTPQYKLHTFTCTTTTYMVSELRELHPMHIQHRAFAFLRRFAVVSPFCFGYPAQPDIASWRIRIIHNHFDRPTLFFATRLQVQGRYPRCLEAFFFTPVDFLSVSRHDARAPLERTKT